VLADQLAFELTGLEKPKILIFLIWEQEASEDQSIADACLRRPVEQILQHRNIVCDDVVAPNLLGVVKQREELVDGILALVLAEHEALASVIVTDDDAMTDRNLIQQAIGFGVEHAPTVFFGLNEQGKTYSGWTNRKAELSVNVK